MDKKTLITSGFILLVLGGLVLMRFGAARPGGGVSERQPGAGSTLAAAETRYDFGTISMKNGLVNHTFKVSNPSGQDIHLKKIATSCMCTTAYLETAGGEKGPFGMEGMGYLPPANEVIKAGESRDIKVVYDPNAHGPAGVGAIDRLVYLTDAAGGTLQLEIKANVTP